MIKIYTTPTCGSCRAAKRYFEDNDIEYTEVDVSQDEESMKKIVDMGMMSVPVFEYNDIFLQGFDISKIKNLLNKKD